MPVSHSSLNFAHGAGIAPRGGGSRWIGLAMVIALHAAVVVALLSYQPVREALGMKPLMVEFITPPAPPAPQLPKEIPKPPEVKVVKKVIEPPRPLPVITAPAEAPSPVTAPPPAVEPKPPAPIEAKPAAVTVAAPPAQPRLVTGVEYVRPPDPDYPKMSKKNNEHGKVFLHVRVDVRGLPERVEIQKSSGFPRLDEAARKAVMDARFKPYIDNGQPIEIWAVVPIFFSLEDS